MRGDRVMREDRVQADEFYIGYEAEVPAGVAARLRRVVAAMVVLAIAGACFVLAFHERLLPSRFDFARPHPAEGVLRRAPYPTLDDGARTVLLVGPGKHGAAPVLGSTPDGRVRLQGTTIARRGVEMLEVVPGSVAAVPGETPTAPAPAAPPIGEVVTMTGEIVDSKCFLGVMNPGEGTVHRDCARLCLRGDIPPMLLTRGDDGQELLVLLVSADGSAIGTALAPQAGQAVSVRGRLTTDGPMPRLWTTASWRNSSLPRPLRQGVDGGTLSALPRAQVSPRSRGHFARRSR
jgi:hypothetical protein